MPIKINGDANAIKKASKQIYTAKFFSKDITGSGKATGMLNQAICPANLPINTPENKGTSPHWHIRTEVSKYAKFTTYPLNPLGPYEPIGINNALNFDASWCRISTVNNVSKYVALTPIAFTISEPIATAAANKNTTNNISTGKTGHVLYAMKFIDVTDINGTIECLLTDVIYTENPVKTFTDQNLSAAENAAFASWLITYNTYAEICKQSEIWQTTLVDTIIKAYDKDSRYFPIDRIIRYISQYKVTLNQYKALYAELKTRFTADEMKTFTKMNTSLLLQDTLENLSHVQFPTLPSPGNTTKQLDLSWCSAEQFMAITSDKPLNQVQAGAGTGKSTVIKARLDYLDWLGVDMDKVMVLSFTNAAADNIKARCPGIQSMTIAKMIDTIYQTNHPTHQLSPSLARRGEGSTFTNSLELYKDTLPFVRELIDATNKAEKNDYATLLRLVEEHYQDIMTILDTVQQTTFHLEIIVCYLEHATMQIPFNIEYLLIDEVQDNAVFEFIFFLNLTCKLKNHLYLVGDCSQTLYEFRASDPKALNAIEGSGLFATFPLNINYRSNQDILQFANALLNDIEANQYANIQLQSFALNQVTKQSFMDNVVVDYNRLNKISDMEDWVCRKLREPNMLNWINNRLALGEKICILTYKRREAALFQRELEKIFPNKKCVSIVPIKNTSCAYFSKYVSCCKQQLLNLPTTNVAALCSQVKTEVIANLISNHILPPAPTTAQSATSPQSTYTKILANVHKWLAEWSAENAQLLADTINQLNSGVITQQRFSEIIGETLIDYEIKKNALKQTMLSMKNATKKEDTENADFIFSTIHSAKGLEFDNVILLYQNKNQMEEDIKRMYYVALTRAKKSEYILAYDTVLNALITSRYETVLNHLPDMNAPTGYIA